MPCEKKLKCHRIGIITNFGTILHNVLLNVQALFLSAKNAMQDTSTKDLTNGMHHNRDAYRTSQKTLPLLLRIREQTRVCKQAIRQAFQICQGILQIHHVCVLFIHIEQADLLTDLTAIK